MTVNAARKTSMLFYALVVLAMPLALTTGNPWIAAVLIGLGLFAHQGFSTNVFGMTADIIPATRVASVIALGAVARNAEVPFEGNGITLAEALGRVGGLNDRRADVKGVFVFRLEDRAALPTLAGADVRTTSDGRVPVVYTLRMTDAASLFTMQDFRMRDGDVLYIATAPGVELERFLQTISSTAFSIIATGNALSNQ